MGSHRGAVIAAAMIVKDQHGFSRREKPRRGAGPRKLALKTLARAPPPPKVFASAKTS